MQSLHGSLQRCLLEVTPREAGEEEEEQAPAVAEAEEAAAEEAAAAEQEEAAAEAEEEVRCLLVVCSLVRCAPLRRVVLQCC